MREWKKYRLTAEKNRDGEPTIHPNIWQLQQKWKQDISSGDPYDYKTGKGEVIRFYKDDDYAG